MNACHRNIIHAVALLGLVFGATPGCGGQGDLPLSPGDRTDTQGPTDTTQSDPKDTQTPDTLTQIGTEQTDDDPLPTSESDPEPGRPVKVEYLTGGSLMSAPMAGAVKRMLLQRAPDGSWRVEGTRHDSDFRPSCAEEFEMTLGAEEQAAFEAALTPLLGMFCEEERSSTDDFEWPTQWLRFDDVQVASNAGCETVSQPYDGAGMRGVMSLLEWIALRQAQGGCLDGFTYERDQALLGAPGCASPGDAVRAEVGRFEDSYTIEGDLLVDPTADPVAVSHVGPIELSSEEVLALFGRVVELEAPSLSTEDWGERPSALACEATATCGGRTLTAYPVYDGAYYDDCHDGYCSTWDLGCRAEWDSATAQAAAESLELLIASLLKDR